jgi:protein-disulfide isomerase
VTIVEFSDFQCPFCSRVNPTIKQITETYGKDVGIAFVNQPLSFHDKARGAAKAFLAASKQGKAWEMHDKMFANQQALAPADLEKYAGEVGLNVARFKKDLDDPATDKMVADDQALAGSVGADGTPTFFLNGREISGAQPFDAFKTIIDEEIKKADELLKAGTKPADLYDKLMATAAACAAAGGSRPPRHPPPR